MQYSKASISLFLFSSLAVSTPIAEPESQTTTKAGFNLFEKSYTCDTTTGSTAAPPSKVGYCFNLDSTAESGSFQWPSNNPTYQAVFYTAPDCQANHQEKQGGTTTYIYTPTGDLGETPEPTTAPGTESESPSAPINCFGSIWAQPGPGSVWMSPKAAIPPGGWPAPPT